MTEEQLGLIADTLFTRYFADRTGGATRRRGVIVVSRTPLDTVMFSLVTSSEVSRLVLRWAGKRISITYDRDHAATYRGTEEEFVEARLLGAF